MGRSRSAPRPAARPSARAAAPRPSAPAPARTSPAAPPAPHQPQSGGMFAGIGRTIADGMAFGTGSAIAHRAVGAVAGSFGGGSEAPRQDAVAAPPQQAPSHQSGNAEACFNDQKSFLDCLANNNNDIGACQFYFDSFQQCKRQASLQI